MLSHAYNDLKSLFLHWDVLHEFEPPKPPLGALTKERGQFCGMDNQLFRLLSGWLREMTVLIKSEKDGAIQAPMFQRTIRRIDPEYCKSWESLYHFSCSDDKMLSEKIQGLRKFLIKVRSNGTFHYDHLKLLGQGYVTHFKDSTKPEAELAFSINGNTWEESRFMFADAAVVAMCSNVAEGNLDCYQETMIHYLKDAHRSIYAIVDRYMRQRGFPHKFTEY